MRRSTGNSRRPHRPETLRQTHEHFKRDGIESSTPEPSFKVRLLPRSVWLCWHSGAENEPRHGPRPPRDELVQVGERLAGGFEFGLQGGNLRGLLGAGLFDDLVDRTGEVLVQLLGRPGDCSGRDREVAGQV